MASCMIHLYAGWLYAQKNTEFLDQPNFYLGCILPDCVNLGGFAKKEIRWHSHLRAADLSQWEENTLAKEPGQHFRPSFNRICHTHSDRYSLGPLFS